MEKSRRIQFIAITTIHGAEGVMPFRSQRTLSNGPRTLKKFVRELVADRKLSVGPVFLSAGSHGHFLTVASATGAWTIQVMAMAS